MRYLYGDSVPFPAQYDFLAALDAFAAQAARVVRVNAESARQSLAVDEASRARTTAHGELEAFHREALRALHEGAREQGRALVDSYVRQIGELAQRIVEEARQSAAVMTEREAQAARADMGRQRGETRDALEKILVAVRLPTLETAIKRSLVPGQGQEFTGTFTFEGGLVAAITLGADGVDEWKGPRRVGDLAQGLSLPVGVRRSLFKRTVAPETITLDDYILASFDLKDDRAEIRLRKKPELADSLVFELRRTDDRIIGEVHYPEDAEAESGLGSDLDPSSAQEIERLWQVVRTACAPLLSRKRQLLSLTLGGVDVLEQNLGTKVVALIVGAIAPLVGEVSRRSPNLHELSLKLENDSGRREEIYLRKAQLVAALTTVPMPERLVFDPLGLLSGDEDGGTVASKAAPGVPGESVPVP